MKDEDNEASLAIEAFGHDARLGAVVSDLQERVPKRIESLLRRAIGEYQGGTLTDPSARNVIVAISELQLMLNEAERERQKTSKILHQTHGGSDGNRHTGND